ncbi:F-type H+-transporting ATPase subunit epsilon [uncultured bacterium]|nr:F-type H+-transporting ATPase subunit epsilon [uncultured bacterium]
MAETILLEIVTPLRKLLSREVDEVTAPGRDGDFGVLAGHTPFLTTLRPGEIVYRKGSETGVLAVSGGYAEVLPDKTTILVDAAETDSEISTEAARTELQKAEDALKALSQEDPAYAQTIDKVEYAQAKLRVKERK